MGEASREIENVSGVAARERLGVVIVVKPIATMVTYVALYTIHAFVHRHERSYIYARVFQSSSVLVRVEPAEVGLTPEPARQALDGRRERVGGILRPVPRAQVPLSGPRRRRGVV